MTDVYVVDGVRTPQGRYGGGLASVRPDDLAGLVVGEAVRRARVEPELVDEVILGAANQAGEDNRDVARMAVLLAGLPDSVPGYTVNRLCASGLTAVANAAQAIRSGEAEIVVAGGVESMTRAPWVMAKPGTPWARPGEVSDTSLGWRFTNPAFAAHDAGAEPGTRKVTLSMGETAEELAVELNEAFAAQAIVVMRRLKLDEDRVNGYGGAIALGHPLGCSGARLVVTLMGRMERAGAGRGLATPCVGVGQGVALALEAA